MVKPSDLWNFTLLTAPCFLIHMSSCEASEAALGPRGLCQTQTEITSPENCLPSDFMPRSFILQHKSYNKSKPNFVYKRTNLLPEFTTPYVIVSSLPLIYVELGIRALRSYSKMLLDLLQTCLLSQDKTKSNHLSSNLATERKGALLSVKVTDYKAVLQNGKYHKQIIPIKGSCELQRSNL